VTVGLRWMTNGLETLLADARYALRALRAQPGFTVAALLSLSLGIGANTAIFTLVNTAMLKSLPVSHPEELVELTVRPRGGKPISISDVLWRQIRDRQDVFASMLTYGSTGADLAAGGEARAVSLGLISGAFFSTLGVHAAAGRLIGDADDQPGCPAVAVITHPFWEREYGRATSVIGRSVTLTGQPFRIIGVAERSFFGIEFGYDVPVWIPKCAETIRGRPGGSVGWVVGRLKSGVTLGQARARIAALAPMILEAAVPADMSTDAAARFRQRSMELSPFANGIRSLEESYGKALFVLMAVVGVVLLIACANIANLLLARATARRREIAIRMALGASHLRLLRQLLTESLLLSLFSTVLGLVFAVLGTRVLVGFMSPRLLLALDLTPDRTVLAFTAAVGAMTGLIFGVAPAWRSVRIDAQIAMTPAGRGVTEGHSRFTLGKGIVIGQVAMSLVAVAIAGLLLGSWRRLATLDTGFRSEHVLVVRLNTRAAQTPPEQRNSTFARVLERLRAIPGVRAAALAALTPMGADRFAPLIVDVAGAPPVPGNEASVSRNHVSDGYFTAIGTRLLAGRDFDRRDVLTSPVVAIVNEALARRLFGGVSPVGR
jgi:putative ABC transport system permease protein